MTRPRVVIDFAPRGLSADEAARYIGVGRTLFEELVARRKMPRPISRGGFRAIPGRARLHFISSSRLSGARRVLWSSTRVRASLRRIDL